MTISEIDPNNLDTCSKQMDQVCLCLEESISQSEEVFLNLGETLSALNLESEGLLNSASNIHQILSNQEVFDSAKTLMNNLESENIQFHEQFGKMEPIVVEIQDLLKKIKPDIVVLKKIAKTLHVLGISSKIEDAKCENDSTDFAHLTDNIVNLAHESEEKLKEIGVLQETVSLELKRSGKDIHELGILSSQDTKALIQRLKNVLVQLEEHHERTRSNSDHTNQIAQTLAGDTGKCITALQFQDITRQQIEHIIEALQEVNPAIQDKDLKNLIGILLLQEHQIDFAQKEISLALEGIENSLLAFKSSCGDLQENSQNLLHSQSSQSSEFLTEMREAFVRVGEQSRVIDEIRSRLQLRVGNVHETLHQIMGYLNVIAGIGEEIHLIAINAQISAFHYGVEGRTLGVIAESIQGLSNQTKMTVSSFSNCLRKIEKASSFLEMDSGDKPESHQSRDYLLGKILDTVGNQERHIHKPVEKVQQACDQITTLAQDSLTRLEKLRSSMDLNSSKELVGSIKDLLMESAPDTIHLELEKELESLMERYTMETERKVHQMVIGQEVQENSDAPNEEGGEDDWDNIELF